jgi:hypothetical protein
MTTQEIINYFKRDQVYQFSGTLAELQQLQESTNNSYNYLIVFETIYFIADLAVDDTRAVILGE